MQKIKIVQIGVSHDHARDIFDSILALEDVFQVEGFVVCEGEEEFFRTLPKNNVYFRSRCLELKDVLEMEDLQAVTVECDEKHLTKYAHLAAQNGLHVHMDKPGNDDTFEYEEMLRCFQEKDLTFHVGYMYRYNPGIQKAMEFVQQGKLGEIYSVEAQMSCLLTPEKRQWLGNYQGGMLFYLGCHLIDLIYAIQGMPREIIPLSAASGFDGVTAQDVGMAAFRYDRGTSFARSHAVEAGGGVRRQLVILGEKGSVEIRPIEQWLRHPQGRKNIVSNFRFISKEEAVTGGGMYPPEEIQMGPFNRYDSMMCAFADMVRGTRKNPWTYAYEAQLHRLLMCACGARQDMKSFL